MITIPTKPLRSALKAAAAATDRGAKIDALSHIRFQLAEDGRLEVSGTNLEQRVSYLLAGAQAVGSIEPFGLPVSRIAGFVNEAASPDIRIKLNSGRATVMAGKARIATQFLSGAQWPDVGQPPQRRRFDLPAVVLAEMLDFGSASADPADVRPFCQGAMLHIEGGKIYCASTNGFTARIISRPIADGGDEAHVLLPKHSIKMLTDLCRSVGDDQTVALHISSRDCLVSADPLSVQTRLIEGHFKNFRALYFRPKHILRADAAGLLRAAKSGRLIKEDKYLPIRLDIMPAGEADSAPSAGDDGESLAEGYIRATTTNNKGEEVSEPVAARFDGDQAIKCQYNVDFLIDSLDGVSGGSGPIEFCVSNAREAALIRRARTEADTAADDEDADGDQDDQFAIIMPML
jgi:DNA polymerase III sliding clamp (beta) subunit (PCNA family)